MALGEAGIATEQTAVSSTRAKVLDWRSIVLFQCAGLFFLLFYYSELALVTLNGLAPDLPARETINAGILTAYRLSDAIQKALVDHYAALLLLGLASIAAVFVMLLATSLRRLDAWVILRGAVFLVLGALAIPGVLWLWSLRWLPGAIGGFFMMVYGAIAGVFTPIVFFVAPLVGLVVGYTIAVTILVRILRLGGLGLLILAGALAAAVAAVMAAGALEGLWSWLAGAAGMVGAVMAYPVAGIVIAGSFVLTVVGFLIIAVIVGSIALLVISQFGHMFIDTLFDASNVREDARAAGRFLVGIGFLCSTILLCFAGNQFARLGAGHALEALHGYLGTRLAPAIALDQVSALTGLYFSLLPADMQAPVAKAFSYGYPPSLELILLVVACSIAVVLIGRHLFVPPRGGALPIAFAPRELAILLLGAALLLLLVFAAAARQDSG